MRVRKKKGPAGRKNRNKTGRKLAAAAAAAAMALTAGAAVHNQFRVDELVRSPDRVPPAGAVERTGAAAEGVIAQLPAEELALSRADAVRGWFIRLPVWIKAVFLLPLWAAGSLAAALSLVWNALASFGVQAAVLTGLFCLAYRLLFPGHRVRELFRKKNLRWLVLGAAALTGADLLLAAVWPDWNAVRALLMLAAGFGVLCLLWTRLCGRFRAPEPATVRTRLVIDNTAA